MKQIWIIILCSLAGFGLLMFGLYSLHPITFDDDSRTAATAPFVGAYTSDQLMPVNLRLNANGTFDAWTEPLHNGESGTWIWNEQAREIQLRRASGNDLFDLQRLRVDESDSDRLLWIPATVQASSAGANHKVYFTRQKE
jgi:hypothetical protein